MTYRIPFNRISMTGRELDYIKDAITRNHISGNGHYTRQCHQLLESELGTACALLTTSCTDALEMSALLLDIRPGDEVILPSYAFVSTVNAFVLRGAVPVFCDIRSDTLNIDENLIEALITSRSRAIIVIHYAGVGCEMAGILEIASRHGLPVVEDNAHGLFGRYHGRLLGTFGVLATQSFHESKNFTCGEGGALLINDENLIKKATAVWENGTDRTRFFQGEVDKYTWVSLGSSYQPSEMLAAFLYAQLEARTRIQDRRRRIWQHYDSRLEDWAQANDVRLPVVPAYCDQTYHMYYLIMPSCSARQELIHRLKLRGILGVFHYAPLHLSKMGRCHGSGNPECPITEDLSARLLRLPFFNDLSEADQNVVVEETMAFTP